MFLIENLVHLPLIVEKPPLNYLLVGSISLHNLGTFVTFVEPYLIILMSVRLERIYLCLLNITISFRILGSHHQYSKLFSPQVCFCLEVRKQINRACTFHSFIRYFKIQTQLTNWCSFPCYFINHVSCVVVTSLLHDGGRSHQGAFQKLTIEKFALSRFKKHTNKVLLHMIVLSPDCVCLDRLQSKLAYAKVMPR